MHLAARMLAVHNLILFFRAVLLLLFLFLPLFFTFFLLLLRIVGLIRARRGRLLLILEKRLLLFLIKLKALRVFSRAATHRILRLLIISDEQASQRVVLTLLDLDHGVRVGSPASTTGRDLSLEVRARTPARIELLLEAVLLLLLDISDV